LGQVTSQDFGQELLKTWDNWLVQAWDKNFSWLGTRTSEDMGQVTSKDLGQEILKTWDKWLLMTWDKNFSRLGTS
jgi:hypothetical protein